MRLVNALARETRGETYRAADCDKRDYELVVQACLVSGLRHCHP